MNIEKGLSSKLVPLMSELLTRIVIGGVFIQSGWAKWHDLGKVTAFFESLGIPLAHLQAPVVSSVELIAGVLVFVGFKTRWASIPLVGVMVVAILTAKLADIDSFSTLLETSEFLYIVLLSWLIAGGSKALSIDAFLNRKKNLA